MTYVRCINNKGFIWQDGQRIDEETIGLTIGAVYKALPTEPEATEHGMIRIIDNSAEDYLYPAHYFEPVVFHNGPKTRPVSSLLPDWMYGVLQAEAIAADKTISALLRELIAERFDLPEAA